jgi:phosphoesterase RecJ-like protein
MPPVTQLDWEQATHLLGEAQTIAVIGHIRPDGDDIGSICGMGLALREMGKAVTMVVDEGTPRHLDFIPGGDDVLPVLEDPLHFDLVVTVDSSDVERLGEAGQKLLALGKPVIVIDHHATNTLFGTAHIVESDFVSASEAVMAWLEYMQHPISVEVATALLTGIVTDTQAFRVGPVTADTFGKVQRLMEQGVDLKRIMQKTMNRRPAGTMPIEGRVMSRVKIEDGVAWTTVSQQDLKALGFPDEVHLELSSEMVKDESAYVSAQFTETETGDVRCSFRSKPGYDVGSVALALGGGGHTQASGCTLYSISVDDAIKKVVPLLKQAVQQGESVYD